MHKQAKHKSISSKIFKFQESAILQPLRRSITSVIMQRRKKKLTKKKRLKKNLRCLPKKILTYQGSVSKKRKSILNCEPGGTVTVHTQ